MRVRVYDKISNRYFKSEVYAVIDQGLHSRYLVLAPFGEKDHYKFIDYLDRSEGGPHYPVNINVITPEIPYDWVVKTKYDLVKLQRQLKLLDRNAKIEHFHGYPWLLDEMEVLASLIAGRVVFFDETRSDHRVYPMDEDGFRQVERNEDIDDLYQAFNRFHGAVLKSIQYVSGSELLEDGSMLCSDDIRKVTMVFESQWSKPIEMVFEGVAALNLRPAPDNYPSSIDWASLIIHDEEIFFCDGEFSMVPASYQGTWIKSYGLKWRYYEER